MKRILQCTHFFGPTAGISASGSHMPDPGWRQPERRLYNAMRVQQTNRVGSIVLIILSLTALLTVLSGYAQPPQSDEGTGAHIFQLSVVALVPMTFVFLTTADWSQPRSSRPLLRLRPSPWLLRLRPCTSLEHYR